MFKTLLCDENNRFLVVEDNNAISDIVRHKERQLWLDIEHPTAEEFRVIEAEFGLHPLAIEDAAKRHQRPKVDQYDSFYFVVFYSVGSEEPGQPGQTQTPPAPGRRGLRGTRFFTVAAPQVSPALAELRGGMGMDADAIVDPEATGQPDEQIVLREIAMFMGENYLITVHEDPVPELEEVARRWFRNVQVMEGEQNGSHDVAGARPLTPTEEKNLKPKAHETPDMIAAPPEVAPDKGHPPKDGHSPKFFSPPDEVDEATLQRHQRSNGIGILLYSLLDTIVDEYFPVIDGLVDRVEDLEEQIFERYNQRAIESIFDLKKDLLALRKVLAPERDLLNVLTRRDLPIFEQETLIYFQDVYDHVVRITDSIDTYRDLLSSALDSFLSMQSNRLNVTVQTLTSVSIMLMSVAAVTGWYGMNFEVMPELGYWWGYPGVMIVVALLVVVEFIFFKRRGWL